MICENCAGIGAKETELGMLCEECYALLFNRQEHPAEDQDTNEEAEEEDM